MLPGSLHGMAELRDALHAELAAQGQADTLDVTRLAEAVGSRLRSPEVAAEFRRLVVSGWDFARTATRERPDVYGSGLDQDVLGAVVSDVMSYLFTEPRRVASDLTPENAAAILRGISYKEGWSFELRELTPSVLGVTVVARVDDVSRPEQVFVLSRTAPVLDGDVLGAAFNAVMLVEEHEAMERFQVGGRKQFDPHWPPDTDPRIAPISPVA